MTCRFNGVDGLPGSDGSNRSNEVPGVGANGRDAVCGPFDLCAHAGNNGPDGSPGGDGNRGGTFNPDTDLLEAPTAGTIADCEIDRLLPGVRLEARGGNGGRGGAGGDAGPGGKGGDGGDGGDCEWGGYGGRGGNGGDGGQGGGGGDGAPGGRLVLTVREDASGDQPPTLDNAGGKGGLPGSGGKGAKAGAFGIDGKSPEYGTIFFASPECAFVNRREELFDDDGNVLPVIDGKDGRNGAPGKDGAPGFPLERR